MKTRANKKSNLQRCVKVPGYLREVQDGFIESIVELQRKNKLRDADVSEMLGATQSYYPHLKSRSRSMKLEVMARLAAVFGKRIEIRLVSRARSAE